MMNRLNTDPRIAALLTIDVQHDFTLRGAVAEIAGTLAAVPQIDKVVDVFRAMSRPIIRVVRLCLPDGSNVGLQRT